MSKYFIINKNGQIINLQTYLKEHPISNNFQVLIEREALKKGVKNTSGSRPEYLAYANKLGFNWEANADIGIASYDYKANFIKRLVQDYARNLVKEIGLPIYEVSGSNIFNLQYPVIDAYAKLYGDRLYQFQSGDNQVVMSYDASYPQFNLASKHQLSYKNLPFAHFSISDCYRHEQSGECMLLYRHRRFFMPDLHPYFKDVQEAFDWYPKIEKQIVQAAKEVNQKYEVAVEVSTPEYWEKYQAEICNIAINLNQDILIELHNDKKSRYWIINVDYKLIDRLGQSREIGCIQIDVENAQRIGIEYTDADGKIKNPVIIHTAVPGGIERFIYLMMDNYKNNLPLWLSPVHIRLLPVSNDHISHCHSIIEQYKSFPIRIEIDDRNESIGKKVKQAKEDLIPYSIIIGDREVNGDCALLNQAISDVQDNIKNKPFIPIEWPILLSKQI